MTQAQEQFYRDIEQGGVIVCWNSLEKYSASEIDKLIEIDKTKLGIK